MIIKHFLVFVILVAEINQENFEFTLHGAKKAITNIFVIAWLLFVGWLVYMTF